VTDSASGYVRADDGVPIYWRRTGNKHGPVFACCNGLGVSSFFFKHLSDHFRDRASIVTWDYRGHGHSGAPPEPIAEADLSIERAVADLRIVLDACDVRDPVLLVGHSLGCQVSLTFALQHPEQTAGLVLLFGTPGRPLDSLLDSPLSRPAVEWLQRVTSNAGRSWSRLWLALVASPVAERVGGAAGLMDPQLADREDIAEYLRHLSSLDPRILLRMVQLASDHDVEAQLPQIEAPALVIASERDVFTPLHRSTVMAEKLPHAELMVLADGTHAAIVEHPETINLRVERFLRERCAQTINIASPYEKKR
jgi:pimeloyl-ACP methyl ester carboxylesterase